MRRTRELKDSGLDHSHAFGVATFEQRLEQWPIEWGNAIQVLLYGDFEPPTSITEFPSLGITVYPENLKNTIIEGSFTVLKATVSVSQRDAAALADATKRINLLLGVYLLDKWGRIGCGWWCHLTHGSIISGSWEKFTNDGLDAAATAIRNFPPDVRRHVEAALFWIREPRYLLRQSYKSDVLRVYSAYWNAFECLVEAVNIFRPPQSPSPDEKKKRIEVFFEQRANALTAENIYDCYRNLIDTGFPGKAAHALNVCFGNGSEHYIRECFRLPDRTQRLYYIRNAINHGNIDSENPNELSRVEGRLGRLWMIVWGMFGRLIPFRSPVDHELEKPSS
ncbi:MAG TPA: hypothetical protein VMH84_13330 [Xanthobacteraceae bacterium]|nr:hypothetical protein [Xanthobacteraceae bacterium]